MRSKTVLEAVMFSKKFAIQQEEKSTTAKNIHCTEAVMRMDMGGAGIGPCFTTVRSYLGKLLPFAKLPK